MKRDPAELDALVAQALRRAGPTTAYALASWVRGRGDRITETQVYRVLARLIARGEARHVWLGRRYAARVPRDPPMLPLVCRGCDRLRLVPTPYPHLELRQLAAARGFTARETIAEVGGLCGRCAKRSGDL